MWNLSLPWWEFVLRGLIVYVFLMVGDNTVLGGLISAATLIALHYVVAFATFKSKRREAWIEGTPRIVVHNGVPNEAVMRSEFLAAPERQRLAQGPGRAAPPLGRPRLRAQPPHPDRTPEPRDP
jgi:hypothetical protein